MDLLDHEPLIRFSCFSGVLLLMVVWELLAPRRSLQLSRSRRWTDNLGLVALDLILVRLLLPAGVVGVALVAEQKGWGLLNQLRMPGWLEVLIAFVLLDLVIYLQHVLFHAVPALWRLHMVHHSDPDFDATTGVRFHPLEILLSLGIKLAAVIFLGAPALAVLLFEVILNATALFNHGNVRLPGWLDGALRLVLVTPDMHRVHHSIHPQETNSNFGFNLPWWDYLLGTYRAQPAQGQEQMTIGLEQFRGESVERLDRLLALPLLGPGGDYPVNRPSPAEPALPTWTPR